MICLDTGVLVAFIQASSRDDAHDENQRLIRRYLETTSRKVVIPSVAYAEFLYGLEPDMAAFAKTVLSARFRIAPFTAQCAVVCVEILHILTSKHDLKQAVKNWGTPHNAFRADVQIMATCRVEGCAFLVTQESAIVKNARRCGFDALSIQDLASRGTQDSF